MQLAPDWVTVIVVVPLGPVTSIVPTLAVVVVLAVTLARIFPFPCPEELQVSHAFPEVTDADQLHPSCCTPVLTEVIKTLLAAGEFTVALVVPNIISQL